MNMLSFAHFPLDVFSDLMYSAKDSFIYAKRLSHHEHGHSARTSNRTAASAVREDTLSHKFVCLMKQQYLASKRAQLWYSFGRRCLSLQRAGLPIEDDGSTDVF